MTDKILNQMLQDHVVVIYDGVCGFCNSSIQFILRQRPTKNLRFISFQSDLGARIRTKLSIDEDLDSIIVVENNSYFKKSKAIFSILNHIQSSWRHLKYFRFIPSAISDFVYDIIATNRYRVKENTCQLLTVEERELFI